jgi:site-specific DNA-cytosine methylase
MRSAGYEVRHDNRKTKDFGSPATRERFYFSADAIGSRGEGLVEGRSSGPSRPWRWRGEEDLRAIASAPFQQGDRWPQPLIRRGDDGFPCRVANLRAYGNAIDPYVAAQFIAEEKEAA